MSGTRGIRGAWLGAGMVGMLLLAGCAARVGPAGVEFAVRAPPRVRVEVRSVSPGPEYVWIGGYYAWRGGDYVWVPGRWDRPPQASYRRWQPGHWVQARQGWYWVEGRWA